MSDGLTIAVFGVALALAALCIALLLLAGRRVLRRHEELIASIMNRYDNRLGEFAQTLNDALTTTLPARIQAAISGAPAAEQREHALLFRELATLRADAPLGVDVDGLRWTGPRPELAKWAERLGAPTLFARAGALAEARAAGR